VKQGGYSQLQARIRLPSIPALDGIRAIAVFLVLFYHISNVRPLPVFPGPLGVLGFFVLSGFLITWLLIKEKEKSGSISLKDFYRRRALRIFPAFYVFWILAVGSRWMVHGASDVPWSQAFSAFLYVSNYFHAILRPSPDFILHTWSLSAEEQFYLLWPVAFLLFSKKTRHLMLGLAAVIVGIWIHRGHLWMSGHEGYYITYAFDTRADALLVGCLLALALKEGVAQQALERICRPALAPLLTCLLVGISVYAGGISEGYKLVGGLTIEPLLVAVLICQWIVHSASSPWKWLDSKPAVFLGRISYPLYLYHMLATHIATRIAVHIPGESTSLFVVITVFTAILIASCSYYIVERPFLALKAKGAAAVKVAKVSLAPRQESVSTSRPTATPAS
jgi:peptidoglycan/LPS O-acetylase OafA/YrhL